MDIIFSLALYCLIVFAYGGFQLLTCIVVWCNYLYAMTTSVLINAYAIEAIKSKTPPQSTIILMVMTFNYVEANQT